jgi:hypothetical protein
MYTLRTLIIVLVIGVTCGGMGVLGFFLIQGKKYASSRGEALAQTFANLPQCKQAEAFNDKDAIKAVIVSNATTIPMLKDVITALGTRGDVQSIFSKELARREKELALYTDIYKEVYQSSVTPSSEELHAIFNNYADVTASSQDSANTYLGILQGSLITLHREYYSSAFIFSEHARVRDNAKEFILFKDELIHDIQKAKEVR